VCIKEGKRRGKAKSDQKRKEKKEGSWRGKPEKGGQLLITPCQVSKILGKKKIREDKWTKRGGEAKRGGGECVAFFGLEGEELYGFYVSRTGVKDRRRRPLRG